MTAKEKSFNFLATEAKITIPFFQRGYVWNEDNWEELLSNLLEDRNRFLGSLIFKHLERKTGEPSEVLVVDGQQRLTTLSILFHCLYNSFTEEIQNNCKDVMHSHLFFKKNATDKDFFIKINHSKIDNDNYSKIIENKITETEFDNINENSNKILRCYEYFTNKLAKESEYKRLDLFNRLADKDYNILVAIDLSVEDNEQSIFDTINNAGVRLSSADTIKNALFQQARDVFGDTHALALYEKYWAGIFSENEDVVKYWNTTSATGRIMRDNIEIFLHSISIIKDIFKPDEDTLTELSNLYKEYIREKLSDKNKLEKFIEEIAEYAQLFKDNFVLFEKSHPFNYQNYCDRLFHVLTICEITTFHPYILLLLKKYQDNDKLLEEKLHQVETFVIRRMITKSETKNYNKICKDFINDDSSIINRLQEQSESDIINGLSNIDNKKANLLLFWVELFRRNEKKDLYDTTELNYTYSLEHIMPQKWEEHWSDVPTDKDGNKANDEATKNARTNKIYSIGNMTLLKSNLNKSLKNYCFERKIEGDKRKKGMREYSDLVITKEIIAKYDNGDKVWNEQKIDARTQDIAKDILKIWKVDMK